MAKLYVSLTPEEVRASIPYDLICMVRYGCTWNTGRRRRAWQLDFTEVEKKASGRLFRQFFEILEQRLLDMNELLNRNIDKIAEEARKGRE